MAVNTNICPGQLPALEKPMPRERLEGILDDGHYGDQPWLSDQQSKYQAKYNNLYTRSRVFITSNFVVAGVSRTIGKIWPAIINMGMCPTLRACTSMLFIMSGGRSGNKRRVQAVCCACQSVASCMELCQIPKPASA